MVEKKTNAEGQTENKGRFEYILSVNGNIICRRSFHIMGFKRESLASVELTDTLSRCVQYIKNDLKAKTNIYNWYSAPQVYENEAEMRAHLVAGCNVEHPCYVLLRDSTDVYVWNGEVIKPYNKPFNRADYIREDSENEAPCVIKLAFIDNGYDYQSRREVCSEIFDGNEYPRFVRSSIDITNSINKYEKEGNYQPVEAALVNLMIKGQRDLTPVIMKEFCVCCSKNDKNEYTTVLEYGNKTYNLNIAAQNERYIRNLEYKYRKRTEAYYKNVNA